MNQIQLLNKIKNQLKELTIINEQLITENRSANNIEVDLLKKKCVELYESFLKLSVDLSDVEVKTKETIVEIKEEAKPELIQNVKSEEKIEVEKKVIVEEAIAEIPLQPVPEIIKEVVVVPDEKLETTLFTEPLPLAEKKSNLINIPNAEPSLHQKISGQKQTDINERINDSRVESLKSAIGLNKKIAYVNELFKENTVEYAKAIDKLNTSIDLNEALKYFNELKHHYSWSNENEHVIELEQLIQKRFR